MKRINFDYEKMNIPELKKLLNERNLKKDGSKSEMIERLVVYSRTNKYLNCPLCGVFHKFIWDGPYDKNTYSCLSCKTLYKNIKI